MQTSEEAKAAVDDEARALYDANAALRQRLQDANTNIQAGQASLKAQADRARQLSLELQQANSQVPDSAAILAKLLCYHARYAP